VLAVLRSRRAFRRLILAHAQSQLGTGAAYVALLLLAYHRFHSGWAVALVLLGEFVPGIVLSAPFGALADRCDRRRLAVAGDVIRAGAFVAIALLPSFGTTVLLALLAGVGTALWRPAVNSALPGLVEPAERSAATAAYSLCMNAGMTAGPALSAAALLFLSPSAVLAINGVTFGLSATLLWGVPLGRVKREADEEPASAARIWRDVRPVIKLPGVFVLIAISSGAVIASAMMNVGEPVLAVGPLHGGSAGYGFLVSLYGIGMLAGSVVNSRAAPAIVRLRRRWLGGLVLTGVMLLGSGLAPALPVAAATFALTGVGNSLITGSEMRLLQELTPERMMGRVFGLYDALQNVALVIAFTTGAVLVGASGSRDVFVAGGTVTVIMCGVGAVWFRPARGAAASRLAPAARVDPALRGGQMSASS
jgi:MFS family permease